MLNESVKVQPLDQVGLFAIQSFTRDGVFYIVDLLDDTCSCPAYKYYGYCKHPITLHRLESFMEV